MTFKPEPDAEHTSVAPILLVVKEKPKHSIAIGGGYNAQSQFIGDFEWTDRNWLGDGRQLSILAQYSNIDSTLAVNLRQPYLFRSQKTTGLVSIREDIQQVPPYTLFGTRLIPRVEYKFDRPVTVSVGYQLEYDSLTWVDGSGGAYSQWMTQLAVTAIHRFVDLRVRVCDDQPFSRSA